MELTQNHTVFWQKKNDTQFIFGNTEISQKKILLVKALFTVDKCFIHVITTLYNYYYIPTRVVFIDRYANK